MPAAMEEVLFFSGSSHPTLAEEVAVAAGLRLGRIELGRFPMGNLRSIERKCART